MNRLGVRLAIAIGGSVAVVIVAVGLLVNASLGQRFTEFLRDEETQRTEQLAEVVVDTYRERGGLIFGPVEMRRLATGAGGQIRIYDADGKLVARSIRAQVIRPGTVTAPTITVPLVDEDTTIGRLEFDPAAVPQGVRQAATEAYRRGLAITLLVAGVVAVAVSILVALAMGLRLTRPLGALAAAARRVGHGDRGVRVPVPSDREGRELAQAFNAMSHDLERSEGLRRRAASDLAHEIATPVTLLSAQLDALADGVVPATPDELRAASGTAGEVARLVGDLHDLAAAEGAALQRAPEPVDLHDLAGRSAAGVAALFARREVHLVVDPAAGGSPETAGRTEVRPTPAPGTPAGDPAFVSEVDPRHAERLLANLLTNAAVYTPPGGTVRLLVRREGAWVRIRVADTGPGIPPEHQPHVFERFYRADPARSRDPGTPGGTGIGLTVARDLARANGGDVRIESTGPGGSVFVAEFPAAD